jgi:tRNA(fMet)-specific endonuclease VapC
MFCLDTNIWSYLLRTPNEALVRNLKAHTTAELCLTELIRAELLFGARRSSKSKTLTHRIELLLTPYACLPFGADAAIHYAEIRTFLEKKGTPISPNDLMIAATARAANAVLVTANHRDFSRIPGLACQDWTR